MGKGAFIVLFGSFVMIALIFSHSNFYSAFADSLIVEDVVLGENHTCVLLSDKSVKCWGNNHFGQLGRGDRRTIGFARDHMGENLLPVSLGSGVYVEQLVAGAYHNCALLSDNNIKCWGRNDFGQLGQGHYRKAKKNAGVSTVGSRKDEMGDRLQPTEIGWKGNIVSITSGAYHTCALSYEGQIKCWGHNQFGQLGVGHNQHVGMNNEEMVNIMAVDIGDEYKAISVSAGRFYTCAILENKSVKCWGKNNHGQLGQGHKETLGDEPHEMGENLKSVNLGPEAKVIQVSSGGYQHTCALLANYSVKCWGDNTHGQLGQGHKRDLGDNPNEMGANLPDVAFGEGSFVVGISAGYHLSCANFDSGNIKCWGDNYWGQLGLGHYETVGGLSGQMGDYLPYVNVDNERGVMKTAIGGYRHIRVLLDDGNIKCWGDNWAGQLGLGHREAIGFKDDQMGSNLKDVNVAGIVDKISNDSKYDNKGVIALGSVFVLVSLLLILSSCNLDRPIRITARLWKR